jgi:hypothetical protein
MRVTFTMPAPMLAVFAPDSGGGLVGTEMPVNTGGGPLTGTITAVDVPEGGRTAELTLELPDCETIAAACGAA